jgi:hypothetical protein
MTELYGNVKTLTLWKLRFKKKKETKLEFFLVFWSCESTERAPGVWGFCKQGQFAKRERGDDKCDRGKAGFLSYFFE